MMNKIIMTLLISLLTLFEVQSQVHSKANIDYELFQREIVLRWTNPSATSISQWVITVGNREFTTNKTNYTLTELEPNTEYKITITAQGAASASVEPTVITLQTANYSRPEDDPSRIPYLRTLAKRSLRYGDIPQGRLEMFFNNLYPYRSIQYQIDGKAMQVDGHTLTLDQVGRHRLLITIVEQSGRVWNLEYMLNVK